MVVRIFKFQITGVVMRPRNINVWPVLDIVGEPFGSVGEAWLWGATGAAAKLAGVRVYSGKGADKSTLRTIRNYSPYLKVAQTTAIELPAISTVA